MRKTLNITLIIGFIAILCSCTITDKDKETLDDMGDESPTQEAFNVSFLYSDSAYLQAKLDAPHVIEIRENEVQISEFDRGFHLEFYSPDGSVQSDLSAEEGTIDLKTGVAEARGNVVVINEEGDRLETEKLNWDKERNKIFTDQFVKIHTKDEIIYGDSLEANTDFSSYRIYDVRGILKVKEEGE